MKEKKGFTLIELLAVIVILAVIALIATPIINKMIRTAREKAFLNSAYGILDAAEYYYTKQSLGIGYKEMNVVPLSNNLETEKIETLENNQEEENIKKVSNSEKIEKITFPDAKNKLNIKGKGADSGIVYIKRSGSIALSLWNEDLKLCAIKNYEENEITIGDRELTKEECGEGSTVESEPKSGMIWDGWITLTLYYPENSTERKWRVGEAGEVREEDWKDYEGPITIPLADVENVYIKYKINGKTVIIPPKGTIYVDIEPSSFEIPKTGGRVTAKINATGNTDVYYKVGSEWIKYNESTVIEITEPGLIEAKAEKNEDVYDSEGNKAYTRKITAYDSVYVREKGTNVGSVGGTGSSGGTGGIIRDEETGKIQASYYIKGPTITITPSSLTDKVEVSLSTKEAARKVYIKIGNESYKEYKNPVEVTSNTNIYAYYVRESDGAISSTSSKRITNIYKMGYNCNMPNISMKTSPSLNYKYASKIELEITTDGENLEYSTNGVEYVEYKGKLDITKNERIYARATNECGVETEYIDITNIGEKGIVVPPVRKQELSVEITALPEPITSNELVKEVKVNITYDNKATKKYYKIGKNGELKEYTGEFKIEENETIYAYAVSVTGYGEDIKIIDNIGDSETNIKKGITSPIIKGDPSNLNQTKEVEITITYDKNATVKRYRIGNGSLMNYNGPFKVEENETIYAINIDSEGNKKDATYKVNNIVSDPLIYMVNYGEYFIIKLNYPSSSEESSREYRFGNNNWTKYKTDGILLATKETNLKTDGKIMITDENGEKKEFKGDFYYINCAPSEILENIYMRWDTGKPKTPEIEVIPSDPTREAKIKITYDNTSKIKEYKIITPDGKTTGWLKYTNEIIINKKNTIVYARSQNESEVYSETAIKQITNIDEEPPVINLTADLKNKTQSLSVRVNVIDDVLVDTVMYEKGLKGTGYFKTGGKLISNNSIVKITENGEYTFYAKDSVGNEQIYKILVENIDTTPPSIKITDNSDKVGLETSITIDYGDSVTKKYKIGENTTSWTNYTDTFTVTSDTIISKSLENSDNTVTVCAQGVDSVGNTKETCTRILTLDIDAPKTPVINANANYPVLTEYGIKFDGRTTINYDKRTDIDNYYSLDGNSWIKYTGQFEVTSGTIYAKSVKKGTGLTISTTRTITVPSNALPTSIYDSNYSSGVRANSGLSYKVMIDNSVINKTIKFYASLNYNTSLSVSFYNGNTLISSPTLASGVPNHTTTNTFSITIPENTTAMIVHLNGWSSSYYMVLYEMYLDTMPKITNNFVYPKIDKYGIIQGYNNVSINYHSTAEKKLYKINDEEWKEYTGTMKIDLENKIIAKSIDKYGIESMVGQYTSSLAANALPTSIYDSNYSSGIRANSGLSYKVIIDNSVINKTIKFYASLNYNTSLSVSFYNGNTLISSPTLASGVPNHTTTNTFGITIPENTTAMIVHLNGWSSSYSMTLYEVYVS